MRKQPAGQCGPLGTKERRALALRRVGEIKKVSPYTGATGLYERRGVYGDFSLESFMQLDERQWWCASANTHTIDTIECGLRTLVYIVATSVVNSSDDISPEPYVIVAVKGGCVCGGARGSTPLEAMKRMKQGNATRLYDVTLVSNFNIDAEMANVLLSGAGNSVHSVRMAVAPFIYNEARRLFTKRYSAFVGLVNPGLQVVAMDSLPQIYHYRDHPILGVVSIEEPSCKVLDFQDEDLRSLGPGEDLSKTRYGDFVVAGAICQASSAQNTVVIVQDGAVLGCASGLPDMAETSEAALRQHQWNTGSRAWPVATLSSSEGFFGVIQKLRTVGIRDFLILSGSPPVGSIRTDPRLHGVQVVWFEERRVRNLKSS